MDDDVHVTVPYYCCCSFLIIYVVAADFVADCVAAAD